MLQLRSRLRPTTVTPLGGAQTCGYSQVLRPSYFTTFCVESGRDVNRTMITTSRGETVPGMPIDVGKREGIRCRVQIAF